MSAGRTARERARAEMIGEIKAAARQHLAIEGASALSLRAVARDLGMVSSAVYRYFPSRDELLTALIIDAYDALGEHAERAARRAAKAPAAQRWRTVARSIRSWALDHPNEWALLYGSPVPGYAAPADTVGHATRVALAMVEVVRAAQASGEWRAPEQTIAVAGPLRSELAALAGDLDADLSAGQAGELVLVWTQLFGLISFELFGHLKGVVEHNAAFYDDVADQLGARLGILAGAG
jgi:AcrR family transcriptional regulator